MVAGEAGADYVLFGSLATEPAAEIAALVRWWGELFVLPCAAAGRFSPASASAMAAGGADFLATQEANIELARALVTIGST
jgi:thiamine-phosphate pyrophosphorylase